jgi:regulator of protease activity HflC (stomatin/prohibitin superfamily)
MISSLNTLAVVLGVIGVLYAIFIRRTDTMHYRAKLRMGVFVKIVHEGWCFIIPMWHSLSPMKTLQSELHTIKVSTTTKDKVAVVLVLNVATRVQPGKEREAMFNLVDPVPQIESHVGKVAFGLVPSMDLDELYGDTSSLIGAVSEDLAIFLNENGYDIDSVNLNGIGLQKSTQESRDAVYKNQQLQVAAKAAGETRAIGVVAQAEAEKEEQELDGQGVGEERAAIADAAVKSMHELAEALQLGDASDEEKETLRLEITKLLNRQLERDTLVKVGMSDGVTIVFPHNLGVTDEVHVAA